MIDEKKLIEEIKSLTMQITGLRAGKGVLSEFAKHYKESVLRIIDEQPKTEWIPYTAGGELPYNGQKVWISFSNEICSYVKQAFWIYDHFEWDNTKRVKDCPTAWMPYIVPQPYKKEGVVDESN